MSEDVLLVGVEVGDQAIAFPYRYGASSGAIRVTYPVPIPQLPRMANAIGLAVATYLGQLCLAPRIRTTFPISNAMVAAITPIALMLYDVRRWKDSRPLDAPPTYESEHPGGGAGSAVETALSQRRSVLLWSGGKDSTLSALLLRANGYNVDAAHLTANHGVEQLERDAVTALALDLGLRPDEVRYEHEDFVAFSTAYAAPDAWNDFPRCNLVPFGRDLLTSILAVPVAAARGAGNISLGHDHECRNSYFDYDGRSIPRNDIESTRGALALEAYIREFVLAGVRLLPPVSGLPELRILHEMLVGHPELMARTAFCFWGRNCGRCAKCLRYYLAQRLFHADVLSFAVNPLAPGACPELDDILAPDNVGVLFTRQVIYCMGRLAERGDIRGEEARLEEFRRDYLGRVSGLLDSWADELLAVGTDPQLPDGFRYDLRPVDGVRLDDPRPRDAARPV